RGRRIATRPRRSATGATVDGLSLGTFACRPALGGRSRGRRIGTCRRRSTTGATVHGLSLGIFACRPALGGNGRGRRLGTRPRVPPPAPRFVEFASEPSPAARRLSRPLRAAQVGISPGSPCRDGPFPPPAHAAGALGTGRDSGPAPSAA